MAREAKDILQQHVEQWMPGKAERETLSRQEPVVEFVTLPAEGMSEGRHSRVSVLEYRVDDIPHRVLWKRMGRDKGLTRPEAELLESRLLPYRSDLQKYGWRLPKIFYTQVVSYEETEIFSYEEVIGKGDAEHLIDHPEEPRFKKWFLLRETLETLARYPAESIRRRPIAGKELTLLPHGLDLKPANVVFDAENNLYFVDLFGPKELDKKGQWLTYSAKLDTLPPDNLMALCATREGAMLRFYRLTEMLWSKHGDVDVSEIRKEFIAMLESTLPRTEVALIKAEIEGNFPWLDKLYSEQRV